VLATTSGHEQQPSLVRDPQRLWHLPVHKLGAKLDGGGEAARTQREHATADAIARFEDHDARAVADQAVGGGQPCYASANDDNVNAGTGARVRH
jgi:hypothetical protein